MPTVGRVVHYHCEDTGQINPAIITRVWSPETVNLQIFADSAGMVFRSSVVQGDEKGQWQWPPRVKDSS